MLNYNWKRLYKGINYSTNWSEANECEVNIMDRYTREELQETLRMVTSTISKCEKAQLKFAVGTSQHTLLKNRIKAMYIAKSLLENENIKDKYTKDELIEALRPVTSIIKKCEKAQLKFAVGTSHHTRFRNIINAMNISLFLIEEEINKSEGGM